MSRSYHKKTFAFVRSSNALYAAARGVARFPPSPISRDRRSQNLRPILRHEYIVFDAITAAAEAVIDPTPVNSLPIFSTSFRIVDRTLELRPVNRFRSDNSTPDAQKMDMSGRTLREAEWVLPRLSGGFHRGVLSLPQRAAGVPRDV